MDRSPAYLTRNAKRLRRDSTDAENRLWYFLRAKRFSGLKFKRQQAIGGFIVDFCCFHPAVVVELDGGQHALTELADRERSDFLRGRGFEVLRFWNSEVLNDTDAVLERIADKVRELLDSPLPNPLPEGEGINDEGEGIVEEADETYGPLADRHGPLSLRERVRERANGMLPSISFETAAP